MTLILFLSLHALSIALSDAQSLDTNCDETSQLACLSYSRTCRNNFTSAEDCGYCVPGFIEINSVCYSIDAFKSSDIMEDLLTILLDDNLPDFASSNVTGVTRQERRDRFIAMAYVISEWNGKAMEEDFELGINSETFLTSKERSQRLGVRADLKYEEPSRQSTRGKFGRFQLPSDTTRALRSDDGHHGRQLVQVAVDWHEAGFTTRVKNQALCGCCWAVATAAAVESALLITNQTLRTDTDADSVSFQQMITCDEQNLGCDGGNIFYATRYVWENNDFGNGGYGGLISLQDYPYEDYWGVESQTCRTEGKTPKVYLNYPKVVTSVNDRSSFDERREVMMAAVSQQPIIATMTSQCDLISLYRRGVLTTDSGCECCEASCIDHAVVIVGYDTNSPIPYWKVRNSWGPNWGEAGHFRVAMDEPGCGWGLFGILAESALMEDAYTTLEALPARPGWWETAKGYQKGLVVFGGMLGCICLCSCFVGMWKSYRNKRSNNVSKTNDNAKGKAQADEMKTDGTKDGHTPAEAEAGGEDVAMSGNEVEVAM